MNNEEFLNIIQNSFKKFLTTWSRSNEKLKILHGAIAKDIQTKLWENYSVYALGFGSGQEKDIPWRYMNKKVDITIIQWERPIAWIAIKFVMQNYSQNSNNYFENMLWETANIRCTNVPYFQIFIIPEELPYYENNWNLKKWEHFSDHHLSKYKILSKDNWLLSLHTPTKTLLYVIQLPKPTVPIMNKSQYISYYQDREMTLQASPSINISFSNAVIYNNYQLFIEKLIHNILSL